MTTPQTATLLHDWARGQLEQLPWPPPNAGQPPVRTYIDITACMQIWMQAGAEVVDVPPDTRSPALRADTPLATAPLRRAACAYRIGQTVIWLGRLPTDYPIDCAHDRMISVNRRGPLLVYCAASGPENPVAAGYINLVDQPTPADLRLIPGQSQGELYSSPLSEEQLADDGLLLARIIPIHYAQP